MVNNNSDDAQNRDNEVADVVTGCLRNSVVLRRILEHVPSAELRQLSLVNKLWKCEAQSVMRKRGQFNAHVKSYCSDRNPQQQLDAFISDLKLMNPVPFSGISIDVGMTPVRNAVPMSALDLDYLQGVVLDQPTLKTLSVKLYGSWMENTASLGVMLAKKVLQDCSGFVEELKLAIYGGQEYFMENFVQDFTFPRLQILKLRGADFRLDDTGCENYMKGILSRAPNLKVLRTSGQSSGFINVLLSVLEGSSVVPVYEYLEAPFKGFSENFLGAIKLEKISLEYFGDDFNFEAFNRITPMLLQQSCTTTLRCMSLDAVFAIPLMTYGIRLENVKDLYMYIGYDHWEITEPRIPPLVKNFDFSHIFPKLSEVFIFCTHSIRGPSPDHLNAIIEQANAVVREPMLDRAARIKELFLGSNLSSAAAQFYVEMFPNTEKLEIWKHSGNYEQVPFGSIWNWSELKELNVEGDVLPTTGNLDGLFCGIFPEEVAELRLKDDEYLKSVNIVPVMPAVTCLKNLRSLSLHHEHHRRDSFGDDATFIFSTVTVFLAFARLPALAVRLQICAEEAPAAMPHLEPYVSVTSELRDRDDGHW